MAELSFTDADAILEKIHAHKQAIAQVEAQRDEIIARYQAKIDAANRLCDADTREDKQEIELLTEQLRQFAVEHTTDKKRSINLPFGKIAFRKQSPKFFFDMQEVNSTNEKFLDFVKKSAPEFLKVKQVETADWSEFKKHLTIVDDCVIFDETGGVIEEMSVQILPDKFTVETFD